MEEPTLAAEMTMASAFRGWFWRLIMYGKLRSAWRADRIKAAIALPAAKRLNLYSTKKPISLACSVPMRNEEIHAQSTQAAAASFHRMWKPNQLEEME